MANVAPQPHGTCDAHSLLVDMVKSLDVKMSRMQWMIVVILIVTFLGGAEKIPVLLRMIQ